jgi:hypothetical protein
MMSDTDSAISTSCSAYIICRGIVAWSAIDTALVSFFSSFYAFCFDYGLSCFLSIGIEAFTFGSGLLITGLGAVTGLISYVG